MFNDKNNNINAWHLGQVKNQCEFGHTHPKITTVASIYEYCQQSSMNIQSAILIATAFSSLQACSLIVCGVTES